MASDYKKCSQNIVYFPKTVNDRWINFAKLTMPTLLIWGKKDNTLSVTQYEELHSQITQFHAFNVINAGHYPHRSNPDEVNTLILDFLKKN